MRNGFSFKGTHSSSFPFITIKTKDRPVMPAPKTAAYEAENMSGDIDFTDYTGQTFYKTRTVQLDITVLGDNLMELQNRMNTVMVWLTGKGQLIFDDIPMVCWTGRVSDSVNYMPERGGKHATLAVSFACDPFTQFLHDAFDGVLLDDKIRLDTHIRIGEDEYLTLVAGINKIEIYSDVPTMPVFNKTETGDWSITVINSLGTRSISCAETALTTVDCVKKQVYTTSGGFSRMAVTSGDFPLLMPGEVNTITTDRAMTVHYIPQFFYNGGMS